MSTLIALVGYRGCGKTAVAQLTALRLGWDWVDADVEIELRAGKSIAAIFADDGEEAFRDLETAVLEELLRREKTVLALGGGVVLREENQQQLLSSRMLNRGRTVWLRASPKTLWARIQADPATTARRPNLTATGGVEEVKRLLKIRSPLYQECADFTVDTERKSPDEVAEKIVAWMRGPGGSAA
jgi:shikimate kinase